MNSSPVRNYERPLGAIVSEIKSEAKQFLQTRLQILKEEMQQKLPRVVRALPMVGFGILLLFTGWLLLSAALVAFLATVFLPNSQAWVFALLVVGFLWIIASVILLLGSVRMASPKSLKPEKTIEVLKGDKLWLEKETAGRA